MKCLSRVITLLALILQGDVWLVYANTDDPCGTCEPVSSEAHYVNIECGVDIFTIANENCQEGLPYFESRWYPVGVQIFNPTPDTDPTCTCSFFDPHCGVLSGGLYRIDFSGILPACSKRTVIYILEGTQVCVTVSCSDGRVFGRCASKCPTGHRIIVDHTEPLPTTRCCPSWVPIFPVEEVP
ncbi:MAG: hypothetical protein KatS3mg016_1896 [Fimbriimonadales bacterium]|nr:MAG: hypothetical protein KatS3mg016_1896 [Fimbriimonadales bacterium]